jgi:hypothetical protein
VQEIDLGWFKPGDTNVDPLLDQKFGQCRKLDRKLLAVPAGALGDAVVGQHQCSLLGFAEAVQDDGRNRCHS